MSLFLVTRPGSPDDGLMATDRNVVEWGAEPIVGWRIWNLSNDAAAPRLLPAGSGVGDVWQPMQVMTARCGVLSILKIGRRRHEAPDIGCSCGIYASRSLDESERPRPAWPPPCVVGTVALWGRVIEHEIGWRGQFAYPARLGLVCSMCAWFEPGPGVPTVVHSFAGASYALCDVHRGGIQLQDGRRTRPTGLDPKVLQARLLDTYAVDLVPIDSVRSLFRRRRTPEPPGYVPSIRVVPVDDVR
jgi:hypothetical protein